MVLTAQEQKISFAPFLDFLIASPFTSFAQGNCQKPFKASPTVPPPPRKLTPSAFRHYSLNVLVCAITLFGVHVIVIIKNYTHWLPLSSDYLKKTKTKNTPHCINET